MPFVEAAGLRTRYRIEGEGPPLLMFSPGGFDSKLENWSSFSIYARLGLLPRLAESYTCITFDRRESGESSGRVERIGWSHYVEQAAGLLDALGVERAHLMGGCIGCSLVTAFAAAHPSRAGGLVLYSPAGGPRYRMKQHARFAAHAAFVEEHGLDAVRSRALSHDRPFTVDPAVGPWVTVLRTDPGFADSFGSLSKRDYLVALTGTCRAQFDRDTVPGVDAEDLMLLDRPALIVPGQDESHAPSAACYLQECLPHAETWNVPVAEQTADNAPDRVLEFLDTVPA